MTRADRYLRVVRWLMRRYSENGSLVIDIGGNPSAYKRKETLAWRRYIVQDL